MAKTQITDAGVKSWLDEISMARKREKAYRKEASEVQEIYEGEKKADIPFNILFSNTETLAPALYNSVPRPDVRRRFKDEDPVGRLAAELGERALAFHIDSDLRDYESFHELMQDAVLNALVPGRGLTRFKYEATFAPLAQGQTEEGAEDAKTPQQQVTSELVCGESVSWNNFFHGYAKKWQDVPWVAFEHFFTEDEIVDNFGKDVAGKVEKTAAPKAGADGEEASTSASGDEANPTLGHVYEIWSKKTKKVYFISPGFDGFLRTVDDPLGLSGFFPMPRPMMLLNRIDSLIPVTLYRFYEEQAKELNRITVRINKVVSALKVRGYYDSTIGGIEKVLEAEDNKMIPAENVAALQQGNGLDKALAFVPIERLVTVLQQLYTQRQQVKQVIFDITGIADIMRGSTAASETLGAQEIKTQWGTMRLRKGQAEVARYARDCLRIMAEIIFTKLSPTTLRAMTGMQLPLAAEKEQMQVALQKAQMAGQQVPPQAQSILTTPSLEDVVKLLSNDLERSYRIDIETDSTIQAEAAEDKQDMAELMNSMSQFINGIAPAVQTGVIPFEVAKAMLMGIVRRLRFGADIEELLEQMQPPQQPQGPDPKAVEAQKAQLEGLQQELTKAQAQIEQDKQLLEQQKQAAAAQQQADQDYMLREVEQAKKFALEEVRQAQAAASAKAEQDAIQREAKLQARHAASMDQLNRDRAAFEAAKTAQEV